MGRYTHTFTEEQERAILSLYVTAPFEKIFCVYDTLPPEQFATLGASFSRSHDPLQARLMRTIEAGDLRIPDFGGLVVDPRNIDPQKVTELATLLNLARGSLVSEELLAAVQKGELIPRALVGLPSDPTQIDPTLFLGGAEKLLTNWRVPPDRARAFIQKWAQEYGHNSIKEMASVRVVCEDIPDISGKIITGHPVNHPQVKSTRYLEWSNVLALAGQNIDITSSRHADLMIETLAKMGGYYGQMRDGLASFFRRHPLNQEFLEWKATQLGDREKAKLLMNQDIDKSVLDYARYLLTPAIPTSLAFSVDCRSLEDIITGLLSSPLREDQRIGQAIWSQARQVTPVLMGEKCHAGVSQYAVKTRETFERMLPELFSFERTKSYESEERIRRVTVDGDLRVAAVACWTYGHGSLSQYVTTLENNQPVIERVINALFEHRIFAEKGQKDQLHPALNHGGEMKEILMDYGGDRDVHRHRRGASTTQTLTPYHGAEIPPEISLAGLQRVFLAALAEMHNAYIEVSGENQYVAQLMTTMAHRRRRLVSWQLGQDGYFVELRGRREGHDSYRAIAHELVGFDACVFPLVAAHLHVDRRTYPPGLTKAARDWYDTTKRNV